MKLFLLNKINRGRQYFYSLTTVIVVAGVCYALSAALGYRVVALILLLTVSLLAISFDILPVLLSAAGSALIWDVFFLPPRFTIHVDTTEDTILLIMYFLIAMINAVLSFKIRQAEKVSTLKEEKANSVKLYNTILNSLSHELRTPIAAIIGAADNLKGNKQLSKDDADELVNEISKASLRLNQQVENLLNISRLESGHIRPKEDWCDVVELVYDVTKRVEENNTGRQIHIHVNPNMPLCLTDKGMLDQILYNLLNNAAIHTPAGTRIDISAACHADLLEFLIADNGPGFGNAAASDVFKKFSRNNSPNGAGSGLGLSIVKGFTEALGGSVALRKENRGGAEFNLSIPVRLSHLKITADE